MTDDIELSFPFRELARRIGVGHTWVAIGVLWSHLATQAKAHGRCGVYEGAWISHLWSALQRCDIPTDLIESHLAESRLLVKSGDDYFCELFSCMNPELDASYIPDSNSWMLEWNNFKKKQEEKTEDHVDQLPKEAWQMPDGSIVPRTMMNRAWVLVNTLDIITTRKPRNPKDILPPTMHTALSVIACHNDSRLSVILRRFLAMSRPRMNKALPHTTRDCLANFDDLILAVMPNDGFLDWVKKTEAPPNYRSPQIESVAIKKELLEQSNRIHVSGTDMASPSPGQDPALA